ncbi:MAG: hypothetical protein IE885_05900 [Campylobacterales bacterium]|nr:hypothetical protein [Campylobacterales bacterium]
MGSLIAYFGANPDDFPYVETTIFKVKNGGFDIWDEKVQMSILKSLNKEELKYLVKMCNQIFEEEWDEFSIVTGYTLDELKQLKNFIKSEFL